MEEIILFFKPDFSILVSNYWHRSWENVHNFSCGKHWDMGCEYRYSRLVYGRYKKCLLMSAEVGQAVNYN